MSSILIRNVWHNGEPNDVWIEGNRFREIAPHLDVAADEVIDGTDKAILPPFCNTHTHAAMTLLRGYADDMELFHWLNDCIWPAEAKLTGEDVYWGTKLAILEMIRSGTVFFNDMYWYQSDTIRAAEEMGVRAAVGMLYIEGPDGKVLERNLRDNAALLDMRGSLSRRVSITFAPHSVYTVSGPTLRRTAEEAAACGGIFHIHASETRREVEECRAAHGGMSPIEWLDSLGALGERTVLAHCVHLSENDIALIRERKAVIAHMPCSNHKLASGRFRFHEVFESGGCRVTVGTDGCASNNSLSMFDEIKFAALLAKVESGLPTSGGSGAIFDCATRCGAEAFGIDGGVIAPGKLADAVLADLRRPCMTPAYHLIANWVYSADPSCVDTVICDGRILMKHGVIEGEEEILARASECCRRFGRFGI